MTEYQRFFFPENGAGSVGDKVGWNDGVGTTYSHSRLSCFEQCPRKYQLRYIDEVEIEEREGIEAFTGTLVHLSLQHLHEQAAQGQVLGSAELVDHFRSLWKER
jgi:hypothetical protein